MTTTQPRPSEEEMWAGPSGERWLASAVGFEKTLQGIGDELLARAALSPGQHVLDIGCGAGAMSLEIAKRVAPGGSVTGLDISPDLVKEATRRATATNPAVPVRFVQADAARSGLPTARADLLVSRFGTMFFTDPYGAFAHLHTLIKPGGRTALAVWMSPKENPWMAEMRKIMATHFDLPVVPPRTPGPFAFEEPDYLRDILTKAGFTGTDIVEWRTEMHVGGPGSTPEAAVDFLLQAMSVAQRAAEAPEAVRAKVRADLIKRYSDFMTPTGVKTPAAVWFATAKA